MSEWLKGLFGISGRDLPPDAVTSFEFARAPQGSSALLLLLFFLAAAGGVVWVYRREGTSTPRVKMSLAALRALLVAALLALLLEPVLAVDQVERVEKSTILLLDGSLSMTTRDRYADPLARAALRNAFDLEPGEWTRAALVSHALKAVNLASALARQNAVQVFLFNEGVTPLVRLALSGKETNPAPVPPLEPEKDPRAGRGTNIGGALRQAVEQVGSDRVAAVILISDGRATLGPPPEDVLLFLKNKDIRLHTVAVGEAEQPRNLRAVALTGADRIYRNDTAVFEGVVTGRGYASAQVVFERRDGGEGDWVRVGVEAVGFPPDDRAVNVKFNDRPPKAGPVEYRIRMEPEPDESTDRDNAKVFPTRVVEEKTKVLLVSGAPAHEYYAIKNVLLRDNTIEIACFLQSADSEFVQDSRGIAVLDLPNDEKGLFQFDVVLLHDADSSLFPPGFVPLLKRFVGDHRGGLGFIAGAKFTLSMLRGQGENADMLDLLPVVPDLDRADMPGVGVGLGGYFTNRWRMVPEPAAFAHPATRFTGDVERARERVWERLPSFYWFFPVLKEKPGAVVLARHEDPRETVEPFGRRPILAVHRYGGGNVMFLACDETFRWRSTAETVFDRFWVQSVRFLMEGRLAAGKRRFRIDLDKEVVDLGDAVQIRALAFDERFRPHQASAVKVSVTTTGGKAEEATLLPVPGKEGAYAGSFAPGALGEYEIRPAEDQFLAREGEEAPHATFSVILPDREMGDVRADRGLLSDLASRTRGIAVGLHDLSRLAEGRLIPPASERVVTQGRPIALWDNGFTIGVLLTLLCAEWILRKRFRMV